MSNTTDGMVKNKKTIACIEKNFGTTATHKTNKGVIEWNFEFVLPKSTLESIEGMRQTYLEWNLKAHIKRPTWNTKDLEAHEHIRIVRTLAQDLAQYPSARVCTVALDQSLADISEQYRYLAEQGQLYCLYTNRTRRIWYLYCCRFGIVSSEKGHSHGRYRVDTPRVGQQTN